jgi:TonB family protein
MRTLNQLVLTFLLNAGWQIALIAAVAAAGAMLLRRAAAHYRHLLWVLALLIAVALPVLTVAQLAGWSFSFSSPARPETRTLAAVPTVNGAVRSPELEALELAVPAQTPGPFLQIGGVTAAVLLALYFIFLMYRGARLIKAWRRTRAITASAHAIAPGGELQAIIERCQRAIGVTRLQVLGSPIVPVPMTVGYRHPLIILPDELLRQADADVLTSAIGHELAHVWRRDYLLNLIYELLYLPISFHPAAALVRRRINQTRELVCDELVTEKLLAAEVYAHSLVRLAGAAVPFGRDTTLTVGITDADILEVRIMSLLRRPKLSTPRKKLLLIAVSLLLAVPCVAAASFGLRFDVKSPDPSVPATQEVRYAQVSSGDGKTKVIYRAEPQYTEDARAKGIEGSVWMDAVIDPSGSVQEVKVIKSLYPSLDESAVRTLRQWQFEPAVKDGQQIARHIKVEMVFSIRAWEQGQKDQEKTQTKEELDAKQKAEREGKVGYSVRTDQGTVYNFDGGKFELRSDNELEQKLSEMKTRADVAPEAVARIKAELQAMAANRQEERENEARRDAELTRAARLTMDQAIQIATSQQPGKVLECSLVAEHWEAPGKLGKDSVVLYHVVILSGEEASPVRTHVLVNAVDGSLFRTEKEFRKRAEPQ